MRQFLLLHLILNPRRAISLAHSKSKLLNSSVKKEFFKSKYSVPSLSKRSDDLVWLGSGRSNGKKNISWHRFTLSQHRVFEIWISPELTLTLLDFFITNLTRSGFKLIEFNSYEIEFGLGLMKMLNLAPNPRQRKSRLIPRPSLLLTSLTLIWGEIKHFYQSQPELDLVTIEFY